MSDPGLVFALSVVAGILVLDTTSAFQIMVSQPLVAATLAGALVGEVNTGLILGAALQLVWIGALPVGAAVFPDGAVGAVAGVGAAALLTRGGWTPGPAMAGGVLVALGTGTAGQWVTKVVRRVNARFARSAMSLAHVGDERGIVRAVLLALVTRWGTGAALAAAAMTVAALLAHSGLRLGSQSALPVLVWAAPMAAAAVLVGSRGLSEKTSLAVGFALGMAALLWF